MGTISLQNGNDILLIDSGYQRHTAAIIDGLSRGEQIVSVVLSHEHEDHSHGCRVVPEARVIAFKKFDKSILKGHEVVDVVNGSNMSFGSYNLIFYSSPGHCGSHMTTLIDKRIAQAGDLLVFTCDGKPTPPYLSDGNSVEDHILSLEHLRTLEPEIVVPGHGPVLRGTQEIDHAISLRLEYLTVIGHATEAPNLADCYSLDLSSIGRHDFHAMNITKLGLPSTKSKVCYRE